MDKAEQNLKHTRRWFEEVWNQRREETIDELLSREAKGTGLRDDGSLDFNSFKAVWHTFLETFPDFHVTIEDSVAAGDKVSVHLLCTGTHQGTGLGIPPTGNKVQFDAQALITWKNGQIVKGRNVVDLGPVFRQQPENPVS